MAIPLHASMSCECLHQSRNSRFVEIHVNLRVFIIPNGFCVRRRDHRAMESDALAHGGGDHSFANSKRIIPRVHVAGVVVRDVDSTDEYERELTILEKPS